MPIGPRVYRWSLLACFAALAFLPVSAQTVSVSPTSLSFGNQAQGTASAVHNVTLKNGQRSAITVTSIATSLSDYAETNNCPLSPATLAAATSCTISITFAPSALGIRTGTLTVVDSGASNPQLVTLTGTGTAPTLVSIAVTPTSASVAAGYTQQFTATGTYSNGTTQSLTSTAKWTSSATSVASVKSTTGLASGVAQGTATITATSGKISGSATLTVTPATLTSISINPITASVAAGGTQKFTATGKYSNGTSQNLTSTATWTSSATSIATVKKNTGLATAVAPGTATITATSGTISGSATLTVTPAALTSIFVTPTTASVAAGSTQQFTATGTYSNGTTQNVTSTAIWTSSATSTATVTSSGLATGVAQGTATITAASGTIGASAALTVTSPVLTSLSVTPASASIAKGTSQQFTATGTYSDNSTQNLTSTVNWSSSSTTVASIAGSGLATGAGVGSSTITATSGSVTSSATLSVAQPTLVSIAVTPANPSFALGTTLPMVATGTYSDGSTLDLTAVATWSTADGSIATINIQGIAASVAVGSTSVTATSGSINGSTTLTITPATLVSIAVTPALPSIPLGTTQQFTATGTYTDGSTQNITGTVQWSSNTPVVAMISNDAATQGLASSVGQGTATITASSASLSGSTTLSVTTAALVSLAVTPANPSIALGTTQQFTATGTFTDGSTQDLTHTATWSSDTLSTATINNAGLAQSTGIGTANVTATSGTVSNATVLTVTASSMVSIAISPQASTTPLGTTQQFTATGTFTDGTTQDVTQTGHWSSSVATVATISNTAGTAGLASTGGTGTTTIGISSGSVSASATLIVNPAALSSIAISPQTPTIVLGTTQQFTATGTYTDGSTQDATSVVTWSSSDATVAIISNSLGSYGLATSSGQGPATISAASNSISSSTTITVGQASISSIAVTPSSISIALGYGEQFLATATYSDGSTQDITQSATWTSSVPGVATVNGSGLALGLMQGTTNVSAASGSMSGSGVLTVTGPSLVSISVTPSSSLVTIGSSVQLTATALYSDTSTQNIASSAFWSTSAGAIATVSAGLLTGTGNGTATVTASQAGVTSGAATVDVGTSADFYIATNGNDSWSGTLFAPNPGSTDGPFATIGKAQSAVQSLLKKSQGRSNPLTVLVRGGSYYGQSLAFSSADSGSSTLAVVWQNYPNETPVLSGGFQVTGWINTGGNTYQVTLPSSTLYFENLFYNGQRRLRPRTGGYVGTYDRVAATIYLSGAPPPASAPDPNCSIYESGKGWACFDRFQATCADISSSWENLNPPYPTGDIELVDFEFWTVSKLRIKSIDQSCVVHLTGPTVMNPPGTTHGFIPNHRYVVENVKDAFTLPGQWFLDRSTNPWTLTYLANPGENPNSDVVIVPQSVQVLTATNLLYVTFRGLTFQHDNYIVPSTGYASAQQDPNISAAVGCYNCQHVTFDSDIISETSGMGIEFVTTTSTATTAYNAFQNGALYDIGGTGIRVGKPPASSDTDVNVPQFTTIQNNLVEGYSRVFPSGVGIIQGSGHDNTYTHNDIYDGYHSGMEICLPPSCSPGKKNSSGSFNNVASFNHVYDIFQGITADSGAIYFSTGGTTYTPPGNQILNNKIHDLTDDSIMDPDGYGGHGIYLDSYTGLVNVENNLVYRVSGSGIKITNGPQAAGQANTIKNNIVSYPRLGAISNSAPYATTTCPATVPTIFNATDNLFYFDRESTSSPSFYPQQGCEYACGSPIVTLHDWQANLYWRIDGAFNSDTKAFHVQPKPGSSALCATGAAASTFYTFSSWQGLGEDISSSANKNPGFNAPAYPTDDYSLPNGSPNGFFVMFDPTQAGRTNPVIKPTNPIDVPATFSTGVYNPATDY
jgi:uncharacterized protein YjdB